MTSQIISKIKNWHLPKNPKRLSFDATAQKNTGLLLTAGKFVKLDNKEIASKSFTMAKLVGVVHENEDPNSPSKYVIHF